MPVNRNALIRYKCLDNCLRNRFRKWTLEDLIDEVSEALYEYEGIDKGVSKRTVQADIQVLRSDKLGYNAPIIVVDRKYYTYEDAKYSITNIPLSEQDLGMLSEAVEFMKQFRGFSHFRQLDGMVQKLEDHIYSQRTDSTPVIDFEKNENLKGLQFLDKLYKSIIERKALEITYQSFKARQANTFVFYGYLLKEFRNRWFLIGQKRDSRFSEYLNLALDRIVEIEEAKVPFRGKDDFDALAYYRNAIGVSVSPQAVVEEVQLAFSHKHAPYVATKPIHHSQREVARDQHGVTFALDVQHNFELEKEILAFGEAVKVIQPQRLRRRILSRLEYATDNYLTEVTASGLKSAMQHLTYRGTATLRNVYSQREIKRLNGKLKKHIERWQAEAKTPKPIHSRRNFLKEAPDMIPLIFNENLLKIINGVDKDAFLVKAIFLDKSAEANWYVSWHQDVPINVVRKKNVPGYTSWTAKDGVVSVCPPLEISQRTFSLRIHFNDTTAANGALKVLPGSHKKRHTAAETKLITENASPRLCELPAGGVHLLHPLTLHASSKSKQAKKRRVLHLEFSSAELGGGLEWAERMSLDFNNS